MVQKIHPRGVFGVPNSGPYVKRFQIQVLLSEGSILQPSLIYYMFKSFFFSKFNVRFFVYSELLLDDDSKDEFDSLIDSKASYSERLGIDSSAGKK